jgi:transposase
MENEEKRDARKLNSQTKYELRKQVVRLKKKGMTGQEISELVGRGIVQISRIWQRYLRQGVTTLKPQKQGRPIGSSRLLSEVQEQEVRRTIVDKTPDQLWLPFRLGTRAALQMYLQDKYGVRVALRTLSEYLKRWGFTPQKPAKKAYAQNSAAVNQWLETDYPEIHAKAKKEKAEIYWGDETGIQSDANRERGFSPRGITPTLLVDVKKFRINMISAISNNGKSRFMIYRKTMTAQVLTKFMSRLIKDAGRKVILILDNLKVHHSKAVRKWLAAHQMQIEVYYLPSYSPGLNPDEYLNGAMKEKIHRGLRAKDREGLMYKIRSYMYKLSRRPKNVMNFFKHPKVQYAA